MHKWFGEYMQSQLERLLPDPFDDICAMLSEGKPFSFSRFGDGEFAAVFDVKGANCDGQKFHPELGQRLRGILASRPGYLMGLQTLAVFVHGGRPIMQGSPGVDWVAADSLHNASMEGHLGRFFDALRERKVLLIGPHHRLLAEEKAWELFEFPWGDCWPQYESLRAGLEPHAAGDGAVFLFCASMTANVLIDDLYKLNPRNTYIDAGRVFDPYVEVYSHAYHR